MMKLKRWLIGCGTILCLGWLTWNAHSQEKTAGDQAGISDAEFQRLLEEVNTPSDKPWRRIPWKISLLEAQQEAARTSKPIFIWAMDGHPLGCT